MNNEEFGKLIKSSTGNTTPQKEEKKGKSSIKQIVAKEQEEVVDQEFKERSRRKKKRGRDEDYFSDDGDDDNEDGIKSNGHETAFKVKNDQTKKPKYRDTTIASGKEQREEQQGSKNQDSNKMTASHLDEEMTKYLGGDEEYTHLVRGLDIALAEKVKRDEQLKSSRITSKQDDNAIDLDKVAIEKTAVYANRQRTSCTVGSGSLEVHTLTNLSSGMISYLNNRLESIKDKSQSRHHEVEMTLPLPASEHSYLTQGVDTSIFMLPRNFSTVMHGCVNANPTAEEPPGKEPPFPVKLHRILSNTDFSDIISWLPHGRSWRVLKPKAFEEKIIPMYFRHAKYASFMRQVNGWGFKRITQGPDHNSYYHELFVCGMQHLCHKMRRMTKGKVDGDPDYNPEFYQSNAVDFLPDNNGQNRNTIIHASSTTTTNPSFLLRTLPVYNYGSNSFPNAKSMEYPFPLINARVNEVENVNSPNALQQHLQHNGLLSNIIDIEQSQLDGFQQQRRRNELLGQIRHMVENNNTNHVGPGIQRFNSNTEIDMLNLNSVNLNFPSLQNLANPTVTQSHLNQGFDSSYMANFQQMTRFGANNPNLVQGNTLNNNVMYGGCYSDSANNKSNVTNTFREGLCNNHLWNLNQQLFMQNAIDHNRTEHNVGLGNLTYNQIELMKPTTQLMRQQAGNSLPEPFGNLNDGNKE